MRTNKALILLLGLLLGVAGVGVAGASAGHSAPVHGDVLVDPMPGAPNLPWYITGGARNPVAVILTQIRGAHEEQWTFTKHIAVVSGTSSTEFRFIVPGMKPGSYQLWVQTWHPSALSKPIAVTIERDSSFWAGNPCPSDWVGFPIVGAFGRPIVCTQESSGRAKDRWYAVPKTKPQPPPPAPPPSTIPPSSLPPTTAAPATTEATVPPPPPSSSSSTLPATTTTGQPPTTQPPASGATTTTVGAPTTSSSEPTTTATTVTTAPAAEVLTTIGVFENDVSEGAEGGRVVDLTITLHPLGPAGPAVGYDGTVTAGCLVGSDSFGSESFTAPATNGDIDGELTLSNSSTQCGALGGRSETFTIEYGGGTSGDEVLEPDTWCSVPLVAEDGSGSFSQSTTDATTGC